MKSGTQSIWKLLAALLGVSCCGTALADIKISLQATFVEQYRQRLTISTGNFIVDALTKPHRPADDGDIHVAGRTADINLASVLELMNAASRKDAVKLLRASRDNHQPVVVEGVWRIWCEHANGADQIQGPIGQLTGDLQSPFDTTNPDHVFEIHPGTKVGNLSLLDTLRPISGYKTKDAERSFMTYEQTPCHIEDGGNGTITLITKGVGANYPEFKIHPHWKTLSAVEDGYFVRADIYTTDAEDADSSDSLVARNIYLGFVKDSPPAKRFLDFKRQADQSPAFRKIGLAHVLGMPRISLARVSYRFERRISNPRLLDWGLPYEVAVVGWYED